MKIFLDTNVIFKTKQRLLEGPEITALLVLKEKMELEFVIPEIVKDESVNLVRRELRSSCQELEKARGKLARVAPECEVTVSLSMHEPEIVEQYRRKLESRIREIGAKCLAYPTTEHGRLVDRCLSGRKPFSQSRDSYRDALIWESILEELSHTDTPAVFVTENVTDFADKNDVLHQAVKYQSQAVKRDPNSGAIQRQLALFERALAQQKE